MDKGVIYDAVSDVDHKFSSEFRNYVQDQKLLCKYINMGCPVWLFRHDEQPDGVDSTHSDLTNNVMTIFEPFRYANGCLVQFWKVEELGGVDDFGERRFLLATRNLPFLIKESYSRNRNVFEKMCSYRMKIVNIVNGDGGGGGVIGRVFRSKRIESTPDICYYSSEEYPHLDLALSCDIKSSFAIPISDSFGHLVGVLEAVFEQPWVTSLPKRFLLNLGRGSSLRFLDHCEDLCGQCDTEDESIHNDVSKIKNVMRVIDRICDLVQTWILCSHCNSLSISERLNSKAEYHCTLKKGEGVVGKAETSSHNLAHFAICLKSEITQNHIYDLEFFLNPRQVNRRDLEATLVPILEAMRENFQTFKLAYGEEIGDNLYVQVIDARSPDKIVPLRDRELDLTLEETSVFSGSTVQSDCRLTIAVNYGGGLYTFWLSSSSEILDLSQQVSQRLNLEDETYDFKYLDDDNDWILLTCTEDLRLYIESSMQQEKYTLMLTIKPK